VQEMKVWPFGVALRGEMSNRLKLRWLKTVVVSVGEKAQVMRQVGTGKASVSEPLTSTGQAVSGMEAARVRSAASAWNVGRRMLTPLPWRRRVPGGERERAERREP